MADRVNKFFAHLPQRKRNHSLFQSNHHSYQFQKYFPTVVHIPKTFQKQVKINFGINELSIMSSMTFAKALREEKHLNRARWSAVADENSSRSKSRKNDRSSKTTTPIHLLRPFHPPRSTTTLRTTPPATILFLFSLLWRWAYSITSSSV